MNCELNRFGVVDSLILSKFLDDDYNCSVYWGHTFVALELTPAGPGSSQVSLTLVGTAGEIPGPALDPIWPCPI